MVPTLEIYESLFKGTVSMGLNTTKLLSRGEAPIQKTQ